MGYVDSAEFYFTMMDMFKEIFLTTLPHCEIELCRIYIPHGDVEVETNKLLTCVGG